MELNNGRTSLTTSQPNQNPSNGDDSAQDTLDSQETEYYDGIDSNCSTPYVSAPSSPGRGPISGFFYSAPASPMHFAVSPKCSNSNHCSSSFDSHTSEFEFSARFGSSGPGLTGPMSSADELFLNGKIRPMKLSTHLEKPQSLAPLLDLEEEEEADDLFEFGPMRGRDLRMRDKSMRRRTRSMSPLRNMPFEDCEIYCAQEKDFNFGDLKVKNESKSKSSEIGEEEDEEVGSLETTPSVSASSSRSSSAGRNSKRWVFLKDFLHRSKSEGRSNNKFWNTISFSNMKDKKPIKAGGPKEQPQPLSLGSEASPKVKPTAQGKKPAVAGKPANGVGKRRMAPSLHELHYTANRAQAEEMRKKTYLPYRQGLLGCLGFSSKGYGAAMNTGFARALNPVSSR